MPRPGPKQKFDTQAVLTQALGVFWARGYANTSIVDLEAAMGISRISIYNKFGSKEGVYLAVISLYLDFIEDMLGQFETQGLTGIVELFKYVTGQGVEPGPACQFGCLLVNAIADKAVVTPRILAQVEAYRNRLEKFFVDVLTKRCTQLQHAERIEEYAQILVTLVWGAFVQNRLVGSAVNSRYLVAQVEQLLKNF